MNKDKTVKKVVGNEKPKDVKTIIKTNKPVVESKDISLKLNQEITCLKETIVQKEEEIKQKDKEIKDLNLRNQQNLEKFQKQYEQLQAKLNQSLLQNEKLSKALEQYDISPTKIMNNDNSQYDNYTKMKQQFEEQHQKMKEALEQKKLKYQQSINTFQAIQNE